MIPPPRQRYLAEIARVLRPGGKVVATYYILNALVRQAIERGEAAYDFRHQGQSFFTVVTDVPEYTIGFDEADIRAWHRQAGLAVEEPLHYGSWGGRVGAYSFQDIVVAVRP